MSGTVIALATAKDVMTQVPWLVLTPRSPEMVGMDTFAIDVSSTFMKTAVDSAIEPMMRVAPSSGGWVPGGREAWGDAPAFAGWADAFMMRGWLR
ncbi:hypothetical protein D9M68_890240 [compost metagenome]